MYKIKFTKFAIVDGKKGNVPQGIGTAYADCSISQIEAHLNNALSDKEMTSVINDIERIEGFIIK